MSNKATASLLGFAVLCLVLAGGLVAAAGAQDAQTHTIFASVVTRDGTPVTDLTAADFELRVAGKVQPLTGVKLTTTPLRVAVIVSDAGSGAFQLGVLRFAQALIERAEFSFVSVLPQPQRVLDFTDDGELVGGGIQRLGRRGAQQAGGQVMEAILEATKDLAAPGKHPVLLVLRVGGEGSSSLRAATIRDALRDTGATMYVVSRTGASTAGPTLNSPGGLTAADAQRQMADDERADTALNLNVVLGDGPRDTGGYQQEIALTTAAAALEKLANEIKNRYEITYTVPAGTKPGDRLQVTTKRRNVTVRAPTRVAN